MNVLNVHTRIIDQPQEKIAALFSTLATENDMMLATDRWSPMKLDNGLAVGSMGGHGPIRYSVKEFVPGKKVEFQFTRPRGFRGIHRFEINELDPNKTELKHIIDMKIKGPALLSWPVAIRWLHDAYIEDAFDKVENYFSNEGKVTEWSPWVKLLRKLLRPKGKPGPFLFWN